MSCVLTMTAMAVLAGLSLSQVSVGVLAEILDGKKKHDNKEGFETVFTDSQMLYNTLTDYDCHAEKVSENEFLVDTINGQLRYYRKDENKPFSIYFDRIDNPDGLLQSIDEFERCYGRNVQDFTYNHIKQNLAPNMRIYDEQVVDDELVLTISVD